ncbi:glycosyltransferase family 25 protein [Sutterella sp.]|uniref:glycosyltransferase family 25 protein n=1 Tax=Sutterella sp. TaxID=1981025 RepID=UPI003FD7B467
MLRLVINLDRSPERWESVRNQFDQLNLPITRISGVDGRQLSTETLRNIQMPLKDKWEFPRLLSPGEVGCYLSHIKCWELLAKSKESWALIIEDDIQISPEAADFFRDASWIPKDLELVQPFNFFDNCTMKVAKHEYSVMHGRKLMHPYKPSPIGTLAYFITKKCALDALAASRKLGMPVDEFLFGSMSSWAKKHPVWKLNPVLALPVGFDSTIQLNRGKKPHTSSTWARLSPRRYFMRLQNSLRRRLCSKKEVFIFK